VLISDIGILEVIARQRSTGLLPPELIIKTSVMMAPTNPASARILETLGADTINIPSDLTIPQIAAIRAALHVPIDFYVEAPDNIGGFLRYYEIPELIRVAAPIYLKFGLRNSPDVYPSGSHIENTVIALSRERVRRAEMAMEIISRFCPEAVMSPR
jgi:peptidase U32-like protein